MLAPPKKHPDRAAAAARVKAWARERFALGSDATVLVTELESGTPGFGDGADILVAHDHGRVRRRVLVKLDVGAANAADFHFHQRGVLRNIRHGKFTQLGPAGSDPHCG